MGSRFLNRVALGGGQLQTKADTISAVVANSVQIASRADWPINKGTANATTANTATKVAFWNGRKAMKNIRLIYANTYLTLGAETNDIAAIQVRGRVENDGGTSGEATWDGGTVGYRAIAPGSWVESDIIPGLVIPALGKFYVHTLSTRNSGDAYATGSYYMNPSRGDGYGANATLATVEGYFSGATAYPSSSGFNGFGPIGIIGEAVDGSQTECVFMLHDSIGFGNNEAQSDGDAKGNRGYIGRGFGDAGYYLWKTGRAGGTIANALPSNSPIRQALYAKYATRLLYQLGENSLSLSTVLADWEGAVTAWKGVKNIPVIAAKVLCKTSSSNQWLDDAGQTVGAADAYATTISTGAPRFSLRIRIDQLVASGLLAGSIDGLPYVKSASYPDRWLTNGTALWPTNEGLHPNAPTHDLAKQAVATGISAGLFG